MTRLFGENYVYDAGIAFCSLVVAAYGVVRAAHDGGSEWPFLLGLAGLSVFGLSIGKAVNGWRKQTAAEEMHDLEGCLHTLHAILAAGWPTDRPDHRLRLTIHKPVDGGANLLQVIEYVGDRRAGNTVGRKFPSHCGVVGKVFQGNENIVVGVRPSENPEAYVRYLVDEYHYSDAQARKLDQFAMTWMAITLRDAVGEIQGIVFCDSVQSEFFDTERQYLAMEACVGIARFVAQRYK